MGDSFKRDNNAGSGEHFCKFDQIAERVREERELAADGRQDERLGHDHDAARSKRRDRCIHASDVETEMVVADISDYRRDPYKGAPPYEAFCRRRALRRRSGQRMSAKGEALLCAGGTKSAMMMLLLAGAPRWVSKP